LKDTIFGAKLMLPESTYVDFHSFRAARIVLLESKNRRSSYSFEKLYYYSCGLGAGYACV